MKQTLKKLAARLAPALWIPVVPTLVILVLALALTGTTSAAPAVEGATEMVAGLSFQAQEPLCQTCHPQEYEDWKKTTHAQATLDPIFQSELLKSHNQESCLKCHTTGFDAGSGKFAAEGVTCEACHGPYKEGHPQGQTMLLPMESDTCRMCHENAFSEWETSQHAANNIDCYDCHKAHTQGLRIENEEDLCNACHANEETKLAHSVHGITGVACKNCHMSTEVRATSAAEGVTLEMSNHNFSVASDVCVRCHRDTVHATDAAKVSLNQQRAAEAKTVEVRNERITELENEVDELMTRNNRLSNVAVVSMGLMLGVGGVMGFVAGIGAMALVGRRKTR